jgi:hypothetical protein
VTLKLRRVSRRSFGRREATMKLSQDCWRVPRFAAAAAQLGEPAGLYRVIDAGSIISGIELGSGRAAIRKAIDEVAADHLEMQQRATSRSVTSRWATCRWRRAISVGRWRRISPASASPSA